MGSSVTSLPKIKNAEWRMLPPGPGKLVSVLPLVTILVILLSLFLIGQNLISLIYLLKPCLS
jgi:hypothetical protein